MTGRLISKIESALKGHSLRALVAITIFTTLLELLSIALLLPLLLILLEGEGASATSLSGKLFQISGIENFRNFVVLLVFVTLTIIIVKNLLLHYLNNLKNKILLKSYSTISGTLFEAYFNKGLSFVKSAGPSALSQNINSGAYNFIFGVVNPVLNISGEIFLIILIVVIIFIISPFVAVLELILFVPVAIFYRYRVGNRLKEAGRADNLSRREQWKTTIESFRGYADIALNGIFPYMKSKFEKGTERISGNKIYMERVRSATVRIMETAVFVILSALLIAFLYLTPADGDRFRLLIAIFSASAIKLFPLIKNVITSTGTLKNSLYTIDIVDAGHIEDAGQNADAGLMVDACPSAFENLEVKGVSFGFENGRQIISDLSMSINRGERVAITGVSGSGKSTLLYLLTGLYKPEKGEILINGERLEGDNIAMWNRITGYVSQDIFLTDATIYDNVAFSSTGEGSGNYDVDRLEMALRKASLSDLINRLPEGGMTMTGEGGALLSGGERQRIALARAFYKNASVLLLDEPTSALDNDNTTNVLSVLSSAPELTIIVITHNRQVLERCDKIINL
ncbi:MAG: ATP-binding cassette domain-containing protein [Bacteroidales bacterium]